MTKLGLDKKINQSLIDKFINLSKLIEIIESRPSPTQPLSLASSNKKNSISKPPPLGFLPFSKPAPRKLVATTLIEILDKNAKKKTTTTFFYFKKKLMNENQMYSFYACIFSAKRYITFLLAQRKTSAKDRLKSTQYNILVLVFD